MLAEMLVAISERLLDEGRERAARGRTARDRPSGALVAWHTDFALHNKPLIVVQDRDWSSLPPEAQEQVRRLQRAYVELSGRDAARGASRASTTDRGHAMVHARYVRAAELHPAQQLPRPRPRWPSC